MGINFFGNLLGPRKQAPPCRHRFGADAQTLGNLADRIASILDLREGIALECACEFSSGHIALLAFKTTQQGGYKSRGYSARGKPAIGKITLCPLNASCEQVSEQLCSALRHRRFGDGICEYHSG
jgi:hypothetical protein